MERRCFGHWVGKFGNAEIQILDIELLEVRGAQIVLENGYNAQNKVVDGLVGNEDVVVAGWAYVVFVLADQKLSCKMETPVDLENLCIVGKIDFDIDLGAIVNGKFNGVKVKKKK